MLTLGWRSLQSGDTSVKEVVFPDDATLLDFSIGERPVRLQATGACMEFRKVGKRDARSSSYPWTDPRGDLQDEVAGCGRFLRLRASCGGPEIQGHGGRRRAKTTYLRC